MESEIILYQTQDGATKVEVRLEGETERLWKRELQQTFKSENL